MASIWGPSAPPPSALWCEGLLPLPASIPDHCRGQLPSGYLYPTRHQCRCGTDHAQGKAHSLGNMEIHHLIRVDPRWVLGPVTIPLGLCALCLKIERFVPVGLGIPESVSPGT